MRWFNTVREQPWRITLGAVGGLMVAIIIAGLIGFLLNENIKRAADEALRYDVEIEDNGDDLRAAVLDMRHYHRNVTFEGPSAEHLSEFEKAYEQTHSEIDELDRLGVRDPDTAQPDEIRMMAREYYEDFRPAMDLYEEDQAAFMQASDRGLSRINEMEAAAAEVDKLGEKLSSASLQEVDRAAATAEIVLLASIAGLLLAGAALAYAAVRVVNELRRSNARQKMAADKVAEASRAKTDFIADISHELRTPLTVLRGNAEIGITLEDDPEHREILEEIVRESGRMSRMVEDLLLLAKSDSASLPLNKETVAAAPFLAELAARAESLAHERGATLETELDNGDGLLQIDAQRIEQAALILVDNAAKYGRPGGPVRLTSETTSSGELRITVEDHGPGIPHDELPRVFERFYRVDKARSRSGQGSGSGQGGSGLGLPIAKTIVQAHGGRIEAASRPYEGTRMSLYLPWTPEPGSGPGARSRLPASVRRSVRRSLPR